MLAASDAIVLKHFRRAQIHHKADGSEVTVADRGAERVLRRHLAQHFPQDAVLGEEYGGTLTRSGRCWLMDPIDGTASYVLGLPHFGTLLSLIEDGEPVFGVIHLPALSETTYAANGHGCWLSRPNKKPTRVSVAQATPLARAQVGLTSFKASDMARKRGPWRLSRLPAQIDRLRPIGDCVQYAVVCRGLLDAAIDPLMHPWDIGALVPCVREAGGSVSDLAGHTTHLIERSSFVAASTETLRRAIVNQVKPRAQSTKNQ
jgi:histidinol-phosphatase